MKGNKRKFEKPFVKRIELECAEIVCASGNGSGPIPTPTPTGGVMGNMESYVSGSTSGWY